MKADDLCFHEHLKSFNSTDSSPGYRGKRELAKKRTYFISKNKYYKTKIYVIFGGFPDSRGGKFKNDKSAKGGNIISSIGIVFLSPHHLTF